MEDAARALRECIEKEAVLREGNRARAEKVRFLTRSILIRKLCMNMFQCNGNIEECVHSQ
jgi:hypothetical protein